MRWGCGLRLVVGLLSAGLALTAADDPAPRLATAASPAEFAKQAEAYLAAHPGTAGARTAWFDLHVLAVAAGNAELAGRAKRETILGFPDSIEARFLVRSFPEAKDYAKFLGDQFAARPAELVARLRGFHGASVVGLSVFGAKLMEELEANGDLMLVAALAARDAGDEEGALGMVKRLRLAAAERIQAGKTLSPLETQQLLIAKVAFEDQAGAPERLARLYQAKDNAAARVFVEFYLTKLTAAEREQPEVLAIQVEMLIAAKATDKALALLPKLPTAGKDPKLLFWRGYCEADQRRFDAAVQALEQCRAADPAGDWGKAAAAYAVGLRSRTPALAEHADMMLALITDLKAGWERAEVRLQWTPEPGQPPREAYVALSLPDGLLEIQVRTGDKPQFLLRTDQDGLRLADLGENAVWRCKEGLGPVPVPRFTLTREPDGTFQFGVQLTTGKGIASFADVNAEVLGSPYVTTKAGMTELLDHKPVQVPLPARTLENGDRQFRWLRPDFASGKLDPLSFTVNAQNQLVGVESAEVRTTLLRYGKAAAVKLAPAAWPELRAQELPADDPMAAMKLYFRAIQMLIDLTK